MRVVISHAARNDLRSIARFTEREWGRDRAKRYLQAIQEKFTMFLRNPDLGVVRDDLQQHCRRMLSGSHIIFYQHDNQVVLVLRILHQRMDTRRNL
jgi:toxin ParE1/3/4